MQTIVKPTDEKIDSVKVTVKTNPPQKFDVQLRRNASGVFIKIVKQFARYGSKVNVPMACASQLMSSLVSVYNANTEGKEENDIVATETFSSEDDNTFLVECFVGSEFYLVRLAKKRGVNGKFIGVTFPKDAVNNFVDIIKSFVEKVEAGLPPMQAMPDSPSDQQESRPNGAAGGFQRQLRRPRIPRENFRTSPRSSQSGAVGTFDTKPLANMGELTPVTINLDRKVFRVDGVKGNRSFIRISEYIGQSKKGTLHIPATLFTEFVNNLNNVSISVQKIPQEVLKDAPAPPVVQREQPEAQ